MLLDRCFYPKSLKGIISVHIVGSVLYSTNDAATESVTVSISIKMLEKFVIVQSFIQELKGFVRNVFQKNPVSLPLGSRS